MANRIKGITVEIGGDTSGLQKSLSDVNSSIKKTQSQLKDVNSLLKLDPSNVTLLSQKQELLTDAVSDTRKKLEALEKAQADVEKAFQNGDIGKDKYLAFQREVEDTRGTLNRYEADLSGLQAEQERLSSNTQRLSKLFQATGSNVDDYADALGSKLHSAIKSGTASSDQLRSAIERIGRSATGGKADIRQLTDAIDTVDDGQAIRNLIQELKEAGDAAENAAGDVGEIAEATKGSAAIQAAEQLSAVGDKIQEVGSKAVDVYSETENAISKVTTYFGETGTAAQASAAIVKNVYGAGVGESMDAVANAVIVVKKNLGELSDTDLTNLTQQALTLDELYGIDMNETLRGVNALMKQYGMSAQEAMDYVVKGTQNGLDKTNELGDNLSEYSGKFAQAGYSAEEYFQLLDNGLQGGAYNLDKVNDAINEVTTRLADGTIGDSIGSFSSKTQELFTAWQNGGATQKQVIDSIVADIGNCTSQQDALNMAALAFGTMAEDGNLKFITSLTSVGTAYDNVKGSAQGMFDASTTPMQTMEANTRQLQQALIPLGEKLVELANVILPPIVAVINAVSSVFGALPEPIQNFIIILGALIAVFATLTPVIAALSVSFGALNLSILPIIGIIAAVAAVIAGIILVIQNWGAITEWLGGVWENVKTVISNAVSAIGSFLSTTWQNIKTTLTTVMNTIRSTISNIWNGIKNTVSSIATGIWNAVTTAFNNMWNGVKNTVSGIANSIKNGFNTAVNFIKNLASSAFSWGADMINGIVNGIRSCIGKVKDAVSSVANAIRSFLHFSVPDEGPLTDYESWMPDFIGGLAKGIRQSRGMVGSEIEKLASDMQLENALPDMNASVHAAVDGNRKSHAEEAAFTFRQPIMLDGKTLTTIVSQIQYSQGQASIRNLGTT